jgi:hypothetical protein
MEKTNYEKKERKGKERKRRKALYMIRKGISLIEKVSPSEL